MKTALVIMAAGIGSRFGGGIKQFTHVGPNGELMIDYSIYDALEAGFNEIVFIIRRELLQTMREQIGDRLEALIGSVPNLQKVSYVFQEITNLPDGIDPAVSEGRKKPWGTGQAVLSCRSVVDCPFAVLNADDYYGKEAFRRIHQFLTEHYEEKGHYCMAGFVLGNTLSPHGSVARGICKLDERGYLIEIAECRDLVAMPGGANSSSGFVHAETPVSMNIWGFTPDFLDGLEDDFRDFLQNADLTSGEFLLPEVVGKRVRNGTARVRCLKTEDRWFGVTYGEDKPYVVDEVKKLTDAGIYGEKLWNNF